MPIRKFDAASQQTEWMLLSYKKPVTASSTAENSSPELAVNEDCRSWWSAAGAEPGEWLCVDLGKDSDVRAIQVNMADEKLVVDFPADSYGDDRKTRHIETRPQISHYTVETSVNGADWTTRETVARECSNGYYEYADSIRARYVRVTGGELPYGQPLRISGLRVFGNGEGAKPAQAEAAGARVDALDAKITWKHIENAQGCNVRYGAAPDKLYLSWLVYDPSFPALLFFELVIATIGTIATCTWIGLGVLIQKFYLRHFRVINIILALTLLECIWGMLR